MKTFRCRCGYVVELPRSFSEAVNRTCPGCGSTLDYLYNEDENEARITRELVTATRRTYIPMRYWPLCWIAIWVIFFLAQPGSRDTIGWNTQPTILTYFLIVIHLLSLPILNWIVGMSIVNSLYMKYTKKLYVENRVAFARAGALDLVLWVPLVCALLVYSYYWLTWSGIANIPTWRTPIGFIIIWFVTFVVGENALCWFFFKVKRPASRKRYL